MLFGFFVFLILLNLLNQYLNVRENMNNCEMQNFSVNKQTILKNSADLKVITENLKNNMDKFYIFDRKVKKNESQNKINELLLKRNVEAAQAEAKNKEKELGEATEGL
tara:strand:+ start:37 stop:360 length:324 start_codon:yes stop_codon:yes gene_type:complete